MSTTAIKERPIRFSGPMVQAILEGRKTQTRRVVKLTDFQRSETPGYDWTFRDRRSLWNDFRSADLIAKKCPYGKVGDRLWVRETFSYDYSVNNDPEHRHLVKPWFWADGNPDYGDWGRPRPSIHMPRWASRITLEITGVRVERLTSITTEDARAEGTEGWADFMNLWTNINGIESLNANPWVWAISFKVVKPAVQS